ncbi:hypothetical protein Q3G72_032995 [Acer saccharum]|nr:hypothetical protein Q3G72_032995 [Acer saccharum]
MCDEYMRCGANAICNEDTLAHCACLPGFDRLYPQDWYLKCLETRKEACGKGDGEGFVRLKGVKFPDARNSTLYSNTSLEECERECLKSCNCTGYANVYVDEMGRDCIAWYGELRDMRYYKSGQDFYLRVDAVELAADAHKNAKVDVMATKSTLVFIIVPLVETILAALCFYYLWRRNAKRIKGKKKQQHRQRLLFDSERSLSNYRDSSDANNSASESGNIEITFFELDTVIAATENFSSANKLGRGGFGPVFKGRLANGQEIAIKRLLNNSGQVGGDEIQENTKRVVGTFGYMSPEYALGGLFSVKSDVFSFGVILLEIVSGKKNWRFYHESSSSNLSKYIWELWRDNKALEIVDSCIAHSCSVHEVLRQRNAPESSTKGTNCSANEVTITTLNAR